jgi:opacity protein-like surface antigen
MTGAGAVVAAIVSLLVTNPVRSHAQQPQTPPPPTRQAPARTTAPGQPTSMLRVVRDRATIWSRQPSIVIAIVKQGELLQAVSKDAQWYEVIVPEKAGGKGETGFVYEGHVELVAGSLPPPVRTVRPATAAARRAPVKRPVVSIRGFGQVGYVWFNARDSFDAIFDRSAGLFYGGGGRIVVKDRFFAGASVERFEDTGERALLLDGTVFRLGIPDTVTITPVTFTGGYRVRSDDRIVGYAGGGAGWFDFTERSDFADASETTSERHASWHVVAGVEYEAARWASVAFEVQYTSVPGSLGLPGISGDFDESNLGGVGVQVKLLFGR